MVTENIYGGNPKRALLSKFIAAQVGTCKEMSCTLHVLLAKMGVTDQRLAYFRYEDVGVGHQFVQLYFNNSNYALEPTTGLIYSWSNIGKIYNMSNVSPIMFNSFLK